MENVNQYSNEENPIDYQREFRIIEFKFIVCISFAYTCLYAIGIVILRNIVDKYILLTVVSYIMSLSIFLLIYKVFGGVFYRRNTTNRLWYQILELDDIYDHLTRQHTIINNQENQVELSDIENHDKPICVICHDYLNEKGKIIKLKCGHEFCIECIAPWCQKKNSCPLCQKTVIQNI